MKPACTSVDGDTGGGSVRLARTSQWCFYCIFSNKNGASPETADKEMYNKMVLSKAPIDVVLIQLLIDFSTGTGTTIKLSMKYCPFLWNICPFINLLRFSRSGSLSICLSLLSSTKQCFFTTKNVIRRSERLVEKEHVPPELDPATLLLLEFAASTSSLSSRDYFAPSKRASYTQPFPLYDNLDGYQSNDTAATTVKQTAQKSSDAESANVEAKTQSNKPYRRCDSDSKLKTYRISAINEEESACINELLSSSNRPSRLSTSPGVKAKLRKVFGGRAGKTSIPYGSLRNELEEDMPSEQNGKAETALSDDRTGEDIIKSASTVAHRRYLSADHEQQRFSFTSTSTGYSSARSSVNRHGSNCSDADAGKKPLFHSNHDYEEIPEMVSDRLSPLLREQDALSYVRKQQLNDGTISPSYLDRIAIEMLDTERAYVNDLNSVIQVCFWFLFLDDK